MFGAVTLMAFILMESLNVSSGSYITSYSVMIPFWSMGRTGSQVTIISVDDTAVAMELRGALAGAISKKTRDNTLIIVITLLMLTTFIGHNEHFTAIRSCPHTGVGSDRDTVAHKLL